MPAGPPGHGIGLQAERSPFQTLTKFLLGSRQACEHVKRDDFVVAQGIHHVILDSIVLEKGKKARFHELLTLELNGGHAVEEVVGEDELEIEEDPSRRSKPEDLEIGEG